MRSRISSASRGVFVLQEVSLPEILGLLDGCLWILAIELRENALTHVQLLNLPAQSPFQSVTLQIEGEPVISFRVVDELVDLLQHFFQFGLVGGAEDGVGAHGLEVLGDFLPAQALKLLLLRKPGEINASAKKLVEVKVVLSQKGDSR